jgi:hypothetical protein
MRRIGWLPWRTVLARVANFPGWAIYAARIPAFEKVVCVTDTVVPLAPDNVSTLALRLCASALTIPAVRRMRMSGIRHLSRLPCKIGPYYAVTLLHRRPAWIGSADERTFRAIQSSSFQETDATGIILP